MLAEKPTTTAPSLPCMRATGSGWPTTSASSRPPQSCSLACSVCSLPWRPGGEWWVGQAVSARLAAVVALALYGGLQAVDGVANKQADLAWVNAPDAEKVARFASAEVVRWIEWGLRSYQNFALGLSLLLFAVALVRTPRIPRLIGLLMALTGLVYLAQGWLVGSEGFSDTMSTAIVAAWILSAVWMIWLAVVAWRAPAVEAE